MKSLLISRIARFIVSTSTKESLFKNINAQVKEFELSDIERQNLMKEVGNLYKFRHQSHKKLGADKKAKKKVGE